MHERTVALVMTGGAAEGQFAECGLKYKALFPVNGRPLVDYILRALDGSTVEQVFILQPADAHLQSAVTPHGKNVFFDYDPAERSIALTMGRGIEHLLDHFGAAALHRLNVMWVTCDIPLVGSEDIDALVAQCHQPEMYYLFTIVPHRLLCTAYPDRRFPSMHLRDRGERYSLQSVVFVDGRHYDHAVSPEYPGVRLALMDGVGEPIPGLGASIDGMRARRHTRFTMRRFIYEMTIRRMLRHGLAARVPRGLYELATRRMTIARISEYLFLAMRMRFGVVVSNTAAFSADVDTPQDAERFGEILRNR